MKWKLFIPRSIVDAMDRQRRLLFLKSLNKNPDYQIVVVKDEDYVKMEFSKFTRS